MQITYRVMTADEAWKNILYWKKYYNKYLSNNGYNCDLTIVIPNDDKIIEFCENKNPSDSQVEECKNYFINNLYPSKIKFLHKHDENLENFVIPSIKSALKQLAPFAVKWGVKIPKKDLEIKITFGSAGTYDPDNNTITLRGTRRKADDKIFGLMMHEFIHIMIEKPIIEKYNIPHDFKEVIVDAICFELWERPHQQKFENSFAAKYITRDAVFGDLQGAVKTMMFDWNQLNLVKQNMNSNS